MIKYCLLNWIGFYMFGDVVSRHVYSCATTFRGQGKFASLFWSVDGAYRLVCGNYLCFYDVHVVFFSMCDCECEWGLARPKGGSGGGILQNGSQGDHWGSSSSFSSAALS